MSKITVFTKSKIHTSSNILTFYRKFVFIERMIIFCNNITSKKDDIVNYNIRLISKHSFNYINTYIIVYE